MERTATVKRATKETNISVSLNIDGSGHTEIDCRIGFFKHMIENFAHHGLFDIMMSAHGDLDVDQHHLVEDSGLVIGGAFLKALGEKKGIRRVGSCIYPMDETLARSACDLCGRPFLVYNPELTGVPLISADETGKSAPFQTDTVADFWQAFVSSSACALHIDILRGRSDHHKIEAMFKASARALREACEIDTRARDRVPSTKGILADGGVYLC